VDAGLSGIVHIALSKDALAMEFSWIAVGILLITSVGLLLSRDWRASLILLAMQYLAIFWLVSRHWPLGMATIKLVAGWMSAAALGMTHLSLFDPEKNFEQTRPRGGLFHLFTAGIVALIVAAETSRVDTIIGSAGLPVTTGGLLLIGMGLLHLGITSEILRVTLGLMTVLAGFEILYAVVEGSLLVAALLVAINLGLALVGSYLLIASWEREIKSV